MAEDIRRHAERAYQLRDSYRQEEETRLPDERTANFVLYNFMAMSILFSANHGCVVSCLSLATARLGSIGNLQSGILYFFYTGSALFGATYFSKRLGPRNALMSGMLLYCVYVAAFWVGASSPALSKSGALLGAATGGVGAGVLWTAQGVFFARSSERYAQCLEQSPSDVSPRLASIFAFLYLAFELCLRALSSVLLQVMKLEWSTVFAVYAIITILSAFGMLFIQEPLDVSTSTRESNSDTWRKVTAAARLLVNDRKMQCMIGMNAVFGFTSAFLNSYVNGYVVGLALENDDGIGFLSAWVSAVAAIMSLVFGKIRLSQGSILSIGASCFMMVSLPFMFVRAADWSIGGLLVIFTLHGIGRATFEGTLKAVFAEFFSYEKEGAFANIILQNGLASAFGFLLTNITCDPSGHSNACVRYSDGSYHDAAILEWLIFISGVSAIVGYLRAAGLHREQGELQTPDSASLVAQRNEEQGA